MAAPLHLVHTCRINRLSGSSSPDLFIALAKQWGTFNMFDSAQSVGSVTHMMHSLRRGNDEAVAKLWEKYFERMVRVAFAKFGRHQARTVDAEDVALSAFDRFCRDVTGGAFPWVKDRQSLWPVLVSITARRAARLSRDEMRQKRSILRRDHRPVQTLDLVSHSLPADESLLLKEQVDLLLDTLPTPLLRQVATFKMEGMTNEEVAKEVGIAVRSVERKLHMIRQVWLAHGHDAKTL